MCITTNTHETVLTIRMVRPEKKNALTLAMYQTMADTLEAARCDDAVRAIVIEGAPGVFTAGNDIGDFLDNGPAPGAAIADWAAFRFMQALIAFDKPVVAAVTGTAIGIGATMLLHCDLVYVAEDARFEMPFVRLGLVPEFASSLLLPQRLGRVRAAEHLLLSEPLTAAQAVAYGLANAAVPLGDVSVCAHRAARRISMLPVQAVRETKRLLKVHDASATVVDALRNEAHTLVSMLAQRETREALRTLLDRHKSR